MGTAFPTKLYGPPSAPLVLKRYESPAAERLSPTELSPHAGTLVHRRKQKSIQATPVLGHFV